MNVPCFVQDSLTKAQNLLLESHFVAQVDQRDSGPAIPRGTGVRGKRYPNCVDAGPLSPRRPFSIERVCAE
jgi:hypothetical protein